MGNVDFPLKDDLTCIKSQGTRGTCVAHAIAAAVETVAMVNGGAAENLSEQDVYYEGKTQVPGQFDPFQDGLYTDLTLSHLDSSAYPFQYEEAWNYNRSPSRVGPVFAPGPLFFGSCDAGYLGELCTDLAFQGTQIPVPGLLVTLRPPVSSVGAHEITTAVDFPVGAPFNIDATLGTIAGFVSIDVPIIVSFTVTNTFNFPDADGYVRNLAINPPIGGHAALIVGFVPNSDLPEGVIPALQDGFFVLKNSWGTGSGDCGFYYVDWSYLRTYASGFAFVEID